jgi:hypothetical protein
VLPLKASIKRRLDRSTEVKELLATLPGASAADMADARAAAMARPIRYPLGSAQAEELALRAGLKPLIRELLSAADLEREQTRLQAAGFVTGVAPRVYGPTQDGWVISEESMVEPHLARRALFVGRDRGRIAEAIACQMERTDESDIELGRLLGYPRCCVEAFVETSIPRTNVEVAAASLARTSGMLQPRLNVLDHGIFHYIFWMPCRYDCPLSFRYAEVIAAVIARRHAQFVSSIDEALSGHRLVVIDEVQLSMQGRFDGVGVRPSSVWPTARDRHPSAALDPDVVDAVARALVLVRGAQQVSVIEGVLHVDGRPVATPSESVLVPFGRAQR